MLYKLTKAITTDSNGDATVDFGYIRGWIESILRKIPGFKG